jgi:hypothetical protein
MYNGSSIVMCLFVAAKTLLPLHCVAMVTSIRSTIQPPCHIAPALRLLDPSNIQAYRDFFFTEGTSLRRLWQFSQMAPPRRACPNVSASVLLRRAASRHVP